MNLRLRDPGLMPQLLAFLRQAHCVVEQKSPDTLVASLPEAADARQAQLELDLYLCAWRILHPAAEVDVGP